MCSPHKPERDSRLGHKITYKGVQPSSQNYEGITRSLDTDRLMDGEPDNHALTASKAAGVTVLAVGLRSLQSYKCPSEEVVIYTSSY